MATCGHCKLPGQTVAHVRTCGQAGGVATKQLPDPAPGNVITIDLEDGYWLVQAYATDQRVHCTRLDATQTAVAWPLKQVELVFPNEQAATDYELALRTEATLRRNSEILHGDPDYCRGCAKGWSGAKWHRASCPAIVPALTNDQLNHVAPQRETLGTNVWAPVNALREQIKSHLHRKVRNALVGHFALRAPQDEGGMVKFYRVKLITGGQWAGKVFVDAQASDDFWPVKAPVALQWILSGIVADPHAAEELYGTELGQCYRCNRTLTDETSRALGIGPECRSKL